jgi:uncharacterized protein
VKQCFENLAITYWVEHAGAFYVYNGISGAVLCVPGEDYRNLNRFLSNQQQDNCSPALLTDLILGRMLVTYDFDELKFLAERYRLGRFDTQTFSLTIVTSLGCNFSCPYCFEAKHPSLMEEDVEHSVLELLNEKLERINNSTSAGSGASHYLASVHFSGSLRNLLHDVNAMLLATMPIF